MTLYAIERYKTATHENKYAQNVEAHMRQDKTGIDSVDLVITHTDAGAGKNDLAKQDHFSSSILSDVWGVIATPS